MMGSCSITTLEAALAGSLPADDEVSLQRHLEECEPCGAALERLAGGAAWRQEVAALLQTDELDEECPAREDFSAIDFTVDHLEPADEPNVLGRLGGYDVLEIIGSGGMGVVLKAFDRDLKRCVAIKILAPHLAQSALAKKRFAREAQAAAAVVHPHVLAIHQVQPAGRLPFLVMPLVAGESLAQRLAAQGALELKEVLRIGMQAAAGLAAAHEQGLVHRDVKPANILLEKGVERAVLTDFGLARAADDVGLTRGGVIAGTPQYMSPEQARGDALDGRSDLFSLGCVLYEMAAGVSPFRADSVMATIRRLVDEPPKPLASLNPELPPWFIGIVDRLLEKDPARRFGSAQEVSDLLERCLAHVQQPATTPLPESVLRPAARRSRRAAARRFAKVALAIAASGIVLWGALMMAADPPDIAGRWSGEDWGDVVLEKKDGGKYAGSFSDTVGNHSGEIQLKWSRIERRYNGTWREGEDRFGELSLRLVGDEIRGALTTDPNSRINPATPRLADLQWTRAVVATSNGAGPSEAPVAGNGFPRRTADAAESPPASKGNDASADRHGSVSGNSEVRLFRLRFKLASDMADDLRQILLGRPGHAAKTSVDNHEILVNAPPGVMKRVETFVAVTDWPDNLWRGPDFEYPRDSVLRAARSFFYACAIEDSYEAFSKLLSPDVLAELKGDTESKKYFEYQMGNGPAPAWEESLRADWPGKKEAIERLVREWNRYPLRTLREDQGVAIGFGVKHFCSVSFVGAEKSFYSIMIRPVRDPDGKTEFLFSSLPPWWKPGADRGVDAWPTFRGDLACTGVATTTLPEAPVLAWKRTFSGDGFEAAAAIVDGVVYVGSLEGKLYALNLEDGETKWELHNRSGFKAAPAVRHGAVYIGDIDGKFHAIDAADGTERWSAASGAEINAGASFYGDKVLFTSQDGGFYCLEPSGGELVWKYAVGEPIQSTPSVVDNFGLLAACDGKLHIVDLDDGAAVTTIDVEDPTLSSPAVAGDRAYWGTQGGRFMAVDWRRGKVVWTHDSPRHRPLLSSAALAGGLAAFGGKDGAVRALKLEDGKEAWSFRTHGAVDSSPVVIGGRVFFGAEDGRIYALDLKTGEKTWEYEAGSRFVASPAAAQGRLIIGSEAGELYCFGP